MSDTQDTLVERLRDYGLTDCEHEIICDRRVVDEAATALADRDAKIAELERAIRDWEFQWTQDDAQIAELTQKLERATGPDRDLDGRIWCGVNGYEFVQWDGAGCVYRDHNAPPWDRGIKHVDARTVQPYTASLDAAIALVERVLPGTWYLLGKGKMTAREPLYGAQLLFGSEEVIGEGESNATPSIALLLALFRALDAKDRADG